jgi:hypothetical protein
VKLEFEVAEALERIAEICGWENIDQIWTATRGFNTDNAARLICDHRADLDNLLSSFYLLRSFKDDENKILKYIENVRKTRTTILDDTELALIHAFRNLSTNRRVSVLHSALRFAVEEGDNYDNAIIFFHRQGYSNEEIANEWSISVDKVKEVLSQVEDDDNIRKATRKLKVVKGED